MRRFAGKHVDLRPLAVLVAVLSAPAAAPAAGQPGHVRLFPPEDLGQLEGPDRDAWQQPGQIMDALGIADGAHVADIGAGGGWFTIRIARRVGPRGRVYAEDVQPEMIEAITRRVQREGLRNVIARVGDDADPRLPPSSLDAALIVDAYHEVQRRVTLLSNIRTALKPNGRLGIVNFRKDGVGPGPPLEQRDDPEDVRRDAEQAGLRLISHETFLPFQYLLVFGKS
jgi:ubiquinone/menaquinone biosynthesis C-methylase UbiE